MVAGRENGGASIAVHSRHPRKRSREAARGLPPSPAGRGLGEGGGRRGPRDLAEARPAESHKGLQRARIGGNPLRSTEGHGAGSPNPLPLGEGWVRAGGGGGRATLLKPARRVTQRSPAGEDWRQSPYARRKGAARALPPSPAGRGLGEGGGGGGRATLLKPARRVTQRSPAGEDCGNPLRSTEGHGAGSSPLSRWERVGVRAGGGGGRATLLKPRPAESHKGLQRARIGGNPPTFDGRARRAPTARSTTPRSAWQSPRAGCADSRGRSSRRRRRPRSSAL